MVQHDLHTRNANCNISKEDKRRVEKKHAHTHTQLKRKRNVCYSIRNGKKRQTNDLK